MLLDSRSIMSMTGGRQLQCTHEMWPDVHVVFPHQPELTIDMADGRSAFYSQHIFLQAAAALTHSMPLPNLRRKFPKRLELEGGSAGEGGRKGVGARARRHVAHGAVD